MRGKKRDSGDRPPAARRWPLRRSAAGAPAGRVVLVAIFKDEFDALLEWVAWHRSRGFTRFVIGDHESRDGTTELLEALEACGVLHRVHVPTRPGIPPQTPFYNDVLSAFGDSDSILGFIDSDEFLMGSGDGDLARVVERLFLDDAVSGLGLNWRVYGSSGAVRRSAGPLVLRFNGHAAPDFPRNRYIKSFVRAARIQRMDVHHASLRSGRYIDALGHDLEPENEGAGQRTVAVRWEPMFVAHYVTKSLAEHRQKKARRGSAAGGPQRVKGRAYFDGHDRNEWYTPVSGRAVNRTLRELEHLLGLLADRSLYYRPCFGEAELDRVRHRLRGWLAWSGPGVEGVEVTVRHGTQEWRVPVTPTAERYEPEPGSQALRKFAFELEDAALGEATPDRLEVRPTGSCTQLSISGSAPHQDSTDQGA